MSVPRTLLTPTRQQAAIIECGARLLIVEANAGAAKTTTLALRIKHALDSGVQPWQILALSYTSPGREALKNALLTVGIHPTVVRQVRRIGTFDDLAEDRLNAVQGKASTPRTPERVKPYVLEAIQRARAAEAQRYPEEFQIQGDGELAVEGLLRSFQQLKGDLVLNSVSEEFVLTPASAMDVLGWDYTTLRVFGAYEALRAGEAWREDDAPVFRYIDDAIYDLAVMLGSAYAPFDEANHPLSLGLKLIVVDEMHDMNRAMLKVLRGVIERNPDAQFIGVGDIDQVIHSEAAARPEFMREGFDVEIGKAERLRLSASYRFGPAPAVLLSSHAGKPYAAREDRKTKVEHLTIDTARDLRLHIARALEERTGLQPRSPHGELAVLLRHSSRHVALENELLEGGIAYVTEGFESYLRRPEVLFVRGVLCCALRMVDSVEAAEFRRQMIYSLMLFAGVSVRGSLKGVRDEAVNEEWETIAKLTVGNQFADYTLPKLLTDMPPAASERIHRAMAIAQTDDVRAVGAVVQALDVPWFGARVLVHSEDVEAANESVQGLVEAAAEFESITSLLNGINARELLVEQMKRKRTGIRLSTIEAAKGLEFDHVIMPDVNAGEFQRHPDDKNLFYVGASRAKHLLTLTSKTGRASPFLDGLRLPSLAA